MRDTDYAYAVANVRAMETHLVSRAFMENLINAVSDDEIKRSLEEADALSLDDYMVKVWDFLKEIAPDIKELEFLIVKNDFHNLKAVTKGIVAGTDGRKYCIKPCILEVNELYDAIAEKSFGKLPEWISAIAEKGYGLLTSTMDGQLFDMLIDKAALNTFKEFSKAAESVYAQQLAEMFTAFTNIKIAMRIAGTKKGEAFLDNAFCECDTLDISELKDAVLKGKEEVVVYISTTNYEYLCNSMLKSMTDFERECDNRIMDFLEEARGISLGPEPLICYWFARETEWKMLRIIVNGKHSQLDTEAIRERMRELYV